MVCATLLMAALASLLPTTLQALPPAPGKQLDSPVAAGSGITYETLLRLVSADLEIDKKDPVKATASEAIAIRELDSGKVPEPVMNDIEIESVKTVAMLRNGKPWVLISFAMSEADNDTPIRKLALFELTPQPRLLDIVALSAWPDDVGDIEETLNLNRTTDAYVFETFHSNSSTGYMNSTLLFVRGSRIEKIAEVGLLTSKPYDNVQEFDETQKILTLPDPGREYRKLIIQMTFKRVPDDPEAPHRPLRRGSTRLYSDTYRWDAAAGRFVTTSKELQALDAFNRNPH